METVYLPGGSICVNFQLFVFHLARQWQTNILENGNSVLLIPFIKHVLFTKMKNKRLGLAAGSVFTGRKEERGKSVERPWRWQHCR
jgi:hypothetical protein